MTKVKAAWRMRLQPSFRCAAWCVAGKEPAKQVPRQQHHYPHTRSIVVRRIESFEGAMATATRRTWCGFFPGCRRCRWR